MIYRNRRLPALVLTTLLATTSGALMEHGGSAAKATAHPTSSLERVNAPPTIGADLSFLPQMLALGAEYRVGGEAQDPLQIFTDSQFEIVRLRLWYSPDEPWHGLESTLAFAQLLNDADFDLMLDLHYSDTWADPGHQTKPAAWVGLDFPALLDSVQTYTAAVIASFRDAGLTPRFVQIGNEIGSGFLWDDGRVGWPGSAYDTPEQWDQLIALLSAAAAGVRSAEDPGGDPIEILVHVAEGGDGDRCEWFFDPLVAAGLDFDVIALSFYPWWHGSILDLDDNLHRLADRYGKPIQIVETSYPWTLEEYDGVGNFVVSADQLHPGYGATPTGQLDFLRDLRATLRAAPGGLGTALLYWEPAFLSVLGGPGNPHENLTLFDFDGDALPALDFAEFPASSRYASIQVVGDFNGWDTEVPGMTQVAPLVWEDTLQVAVGCHLLKFLTDGTWDTPYDFGSGDGEDPDCGVPMQGPACLAAYPGTALGRISFPATGAYRFRLDERDWSYAIEPVTTSSIGEPPDGDTGHDGHDPLLWLPFRRSR